MRVDVSLIPGEVAAKDVSNAAVVVIDVLRASSTVATALANSCEEVIPAESIEEAITIASGYARPDYVLGGERRGLAVDGFDLGNSPGEYSEARVAGRKVILATTNGTRAVKQYGGARQIVLACFLNASAVLDMLAAADDRDVMLLCAGQDGRFSIEDALCAGLFASELARLTGASLSDSARAASAIYEHRRGSIEDALIESEHGAYLAEIGFADDVRYCARQSVLEVVPKVYDRRVIRKARLGTGES
jgi:2-phosphosulfolactate phosphatase